MHTTELANASSTSTVKPEQSISDYDWVLVALVAGETAVKEILCYKNIKK